VYVSALHNLSTVALSSCSSNIPRSSLILWVPMKQCQTRKEGSRIIWW